MRSQSEVTPNQWDGIQMALDHPEAAFFCRVGFGKTVMTLTALKELRDRGKVFRTLILATRRVCQTVWRQEAAGWEHLFGQFTFSVANGTMQRIVNALESDADIILMNYENLHRAVKFMEETKWFTRHRTLPFEMVVFDELSKMSNPTSQRSKAIQKLRSTGGIHRTLGLTATPATNGLMKLYGEYRALDEGKTFPYGVTAFKHRFFTPNHDGTQWLPRVGTQDQLMKMVAPITYVAPKTKRDMNPPIVNPIYVDFDEKLRAQYDELEREFFLELDQVGDEIVAFNAAALTNKCIQFCNGWVYNLEGRTMPVHELKLDALADLRESLEGRQLLVCYAYRSCAAAIKERFPDCEDAADWKDADTLIQLWNEGEIPMLIGHPASMGHGLNLQQPCSDIAWFGVTWDLELYEQAIGRLDRTGQDEKVVVHRITIPDTLEDVQVRRLKGKSATQESFIDSLSKYRRLTHGTDLAKAS